MGKNGTVAVPELAPRRTIGGIIAVWVVAAVIGVLVGLFAGDDWRVALDVARSALDGAS